MQTKIVNPNVSNFVKSLRDIGYSLEVAVADILDNSIAAGASQIDIHMVSEPKLIFCMLDNGIGMSSNELVEAMRLATKDPDSDRAKNDLGRFGLGLKMASFSQCKKLTVISKKNGKISARQWDLDFISKEEKWLLISLDTIAISKIPLFKELQKQDSGTLVVWQEIDGFSSSNLTDSIDKLRKHLSLVFHRFLEGIIGIKKLSIKINKSQLKPFNPFNVNHPATQQLSNEKIKVHDETIIIQPFILPHHSKVSQQEYEQYATEEGYTKSQGFYLYRANRLLIYGTWWGLHRATDVHKLVRVRIDISNSMDKYWRIDIKKSTANPVSDLKDDLKRIIKQITEIGSRPYTGRGRKIEDKLSTKFWELESFNGQIRFALNSEHPVLKKLTAQLSDENSDLLNIYLKGLQAYLPLDAIQAQLQQNPHKINQESALSENEIKALAEKLKSSGLDEEYIESLLKTELFKNHKELLRNGK
ncbi:ATP-binding protein [Paenibacillus xerothermodurans]|uniref:ATP-binding protein n=1 Tax=Paenibacillus xerothermodurans TaxID=1977292 RepID=A0A2W1N7E4_PAEXE|nr:ATP-binding protein [Paenibacillus xerothermodurans]PZE20327.1 ATP-binding protein [Paenibacillus xerothermodurans]